MAKKAKKKAKKAARKKAAKKKASKKKAVKKASKKKASKKKAGKKAAAKRKPAKKASKKKSDKKKAAKKASRKKAAKKKSSSKKKSTSRMSTGKGASPATIGGDLVAHVNAMGDDEKLWKMRFAKSFTSIEGTGDAYHGMKAVKKKCDEWMDQHIIHSCNAAGPFVGATGFSVVFDMDIEMKATGHRMQMQEVGVYTVKNGKVIQEEFMYPPMG